MIASEITEAGFGNGSRDSDVARRRGRQADLPQVIRVDLATRLRARSAEIEKAIFSRIRRLSEPVGDEDPAYVVGLERALSEALDYGLEGIEKGPGSPVPIPPETARQARRAAREGVRLDTVLLRYTAGNKSLEEFVVAVADDAPSRVLCQILNDQGPHLHRLMESVAAEYRDELEQTRQSVVEKHSEHILRFLEGDGLIAPIDISYDFELWHIAMILTGPGTGKKVLGLAERIGCRSVSIVRDHETTWAWFGGVREPDMAELVRLLDENVPKGMSVAIGEPRQGVNGWRQTFREAQAALQVLVRRPQPVTRCRDVLLVSAVMGNRWLATALIETYLAPLDGRGGAGKSFRKTLRAYFKADQNIASAALALGVSRHTVERHLRRVEEKLGQTLDTCNAQLQVALGAEELISSADETQQNPST